MNPSTICCLHPVLHTNRQLSLSNFTTLLALAVLFSLLLFISITLSSFPSPLPLCSLSVLGWLSLSSPSADSLPRLQSLLYGRASLPRHMRGLQKSLSASFCILARFSHQPSFRTCTPILAFLFAIHAVSGSQLQRQEQLLKIIRIDPPGGPLAGGTTVTVIGSGFTGSFTAASSHALCKFGDVQIVPSFLTASRMICTSPPSQHVNPDGVSFQVSNDGGYTFSLDEFSFSYALAESITSLSPSQGPDSGNTADRKSVV